MRPPEARFSASTMTSSSIRLSFDGAQVDCRTKMSLPRTFVEFDADFAVGEAADVGAPGNMQTFTRPRPPVSGWRCR